MPMTETAEPAVLWTWAALLLVLALVICGQTALRGPPEDRVVGLELAGVVTSLLLLALAKVVGQPVLVDLGFALCLLSFGAGLVFARFLERLT